MKDSNSFGVTDQSGTSSTGPRRRDSHRSMLAQLSFSVSTAAWILAVYISAFTGCAKPGDISAKPKPTPYENLAPEEKLAMSEVLSDEAEELIAFESMNEAFGKFNEAIQLNPSNLRAKFWSEITGAILETKGLMSRVKPIYLAQPNGEAWYDQVISNLRANASPSYSKFISEGPNDIKTEEQFRELMDRLIVRLDGLRDFLRINRDHEFTLRAPFEFIQSNWFGGGRSADPCFAAMSVISTRFENCGSSRIVTIKMNRADIEAVQFLVSIQMAQLAMFYAYRLNPLFVFDSMDGVSQKRKFAFVTKGFDGGLLARNRIALLKTIAPDFLAAQKFVAENQAELCKNANNRFEPNARPGYLISSSLCFDRREDSQDMRTLRVLEALVAGRAIKVNQSYLQKPVVINPMKFLTSPVANITSLFPTKYSESDGRGTEYDEKAYEPYFEEGTINDVLRASLEEQGRLGEISRQESKRGGR